MAQTSSRLSPKTEVRVPLGSRKEPSQGFTLLETLIALVIVATGFVGAWGALPEGLGAQGKAAKLEAAADLAQSILAQDLRQDGVEGSYSWHIDTAPVEGIRPRQAGEFGGTLVNVTVQWPEGSQVRSLRLQTVRLGFMPGNS